MERWQLAPRAFASSSTPRRRRSTCASPSAAAAAGCGLHRTVRSATPGRRDAGGYFTVRAGSLVAWQLGRRRSPVPHRRRAHRQPEPARQAASRPLRRGWQVVALEPYGGAWLNSWLDRDLGISGQLSVRTGGRSEATRESAEATRSSTGSSASTTRSCGCRSWPSTSPRTARPSTLNPQRHVNAVWGVGAGARSFVGYVAERADVDPDDVLAVDLMTHDLTPSTLGRCASAIWSARRGWTTRAPATPGWRRFLAAEPGSTCRCWRCSTTRRSARRPITARSPSCC